MKKYVFGTLLLLVAMLLWNIDLKNFFLKNGGCPFCDAKNVQNSGFYESATTLGLATYKPITAGHVLIVPKRHVPRFEDLTSEEIAAIGDAVKTIDSQVKKVYHNKDYLLLQKNGRTAGQTVPHVHFHYIPGKNFLIWNFVLRPLMKPITPEQIHEIKDALCHYSH